MPRLNQFFSHMQARGLVSNSTIPHRKTLLEPGARVSAYCGFDPTAAQLHLGNFLQMVNLARAAQFGVLPVFVLGGATAGIGDPSGKSGERARLPAATVAAFKASVEKSMRRIAESIMADLGRRHPGSVAEFRVVDNAEFYKDLGFLDFLKTFGAHFSMSSLLGRETVAKRLQQSQPLSFSEFSYQLLQATDFLQLHRQFNTVLQLGGSDQWGNMVGGVELVGRVAGAEAHALTSPLLLDAQGRKFGKSEGGAVFLAPDQLDSLLETHQYLFNAADDLVQTLLFSATLMDAAEIAELMRAHNERPEARLAQRKLGEQVVLLASGDAQLARRVASHERFFSVRPEDYASLGREAVRDFFKDFLHTASVAPAAKGEPIGKLIQGLMRPQKPMREIRTAVETGGVSVNGKKARAAEQKLAEFLAAETNCALIKFGKRGLLLVLFDD